MFSEDDDDISDLLDDAPTPDPVAERIAKAKAIVNGRSAEPPKRRAVRVGPLETIHDVRHEAARLYRALRTSDEGDSHLLVAAPHALRALRLLGDMLKNVEIERELKEVKDQIRAMRSGR